MEDTDWRPSPCPKCGNWREAARNPRCEHCESAPTFRSQRGADLKSMEKMTDAKTTPDWGARTDGHPLPPSTLYDPIPRTDLTVPPMTHPELTRLHAELTSLRAALDAAGTLAQEAILDAIVAQGQAEEAHEARLKAEAERDDLARRVEAFEQLSAMSAAQGGPSILRTRMQLRAAQVRANNAEAELDAARAAVAFVRNVAQSAMTAEHDQDEREFLLDLDTLRFQRDCDISAARHIRAMIQTQEDKK